MKYKSNYIEKINILPYEIQDTILDKVFVDHKSFLYSPRTKYELSEELLDAHEERIEKYFNRIIGDKLPFNLYEILKTLEDKEKILHIFDVDDEEPIIYIDRIKILNDILGREQTDEDLKEFKLNLYEEGEVSQEFYEFYKKKVKTFTIEDALILLIHNFNTDIKWFSKILEIPIDEFYTMIGYLANLDIKYIDNKVILNWEIEF